MAFGSTVRDCRRALARMGLDVKKIPVTQMPASSTSVGLYWPGEGRIEVRSDMVGCALARVVLHEFGHALGLEHGTRGIMLAKRRARADFSESAPTARQFKLWSCEIARLVLKMREKKWRV